MTNNKKLRKPITFPLPLTMFLCALLGTSNFIMAMNGPAEEEPESEKKLNQSLIHQFATVKEDDLLTTIYPTVLRNRLKQTVNNDRFLKGELTRHYAEDLLEYLKRDASPNEIYRHLGICKTICEPGAAEATVRNNMPQGVIASPLTIDLYFESVGVKYRGWDDAEMLLKAHEYGVPLRVDPKTKERIPLVLTPEELDRYQTHHDFRVAIHGFYKDYTKLINAQRAKEGHPPIKDYADDYTKHDVSEIPMSYREKQEMIRNAKMKLQEQALKWEKEKIERLAKREEEEAQKAHELAEKAQKAHEIAEKAREARELAEKAREDRKARELAEAQKDREIEEKKGAEELAKLQKEQEKIEVEHKNNLEEQAKVQEAQKLLLEQVLQNEEKMRVLGLKIQEAEKLKNERVIQDQEKELQLIQDEEFARALDRELNGKI